MIINKKAHNWCRNCRHAKCWWRGLVNWLSIFSAVALFAGCGMLPLAPGKASFASATTSGQLVQSENPKGESKQVFSRTEEAGKVTETVETVIGGAQKDLGREIAAKLSSMKGIMYLGALVFIFGAASAFWLPLKTLIGSTTTSAVIAASGLALIVLPTLVVGNEILILCVALGGAALYFFSHRHGKLQGVVNTLQK